MYDAHDLSDPDWLEAFAAQWHFLADLSFSDLVMWELVDEQSGTFRATHQIRPVTGPTALEDDVVGEVIMYEPDHPVQVAWMTEEVVGTSDNALEAGIPVDVEAIPVLRNDRPIAVIECHTNQMGVRANGALEEAFLDIAAILKQMLLRGEFPLLQPADKALAPRVADGVLRVEADGTITYASPNAVTGFRRLGAERDIVGENFRELTASLHDRVEAVGQTVNKELDGTLSLEFEIAQVNSSMRFLLLPLWLERKNAGMLVLCRDTTDLRRRDRMIVTKDATIREIHHRVKNNLQTVAALLRMQSRRLKSEEGKEALRDAMRRVSSIAVVHETLSQSLTEDVAFDDICDKILTMVGDLAASSGTVNARREGSFGVIPADAATSLSMVVTELCQNAIEHGLASENGEVRVIPMRANGRLRMVITDDGGGLQDDFVLGNQTSLGLSIISTLVADMDGKFEMRNRDGHPGTEAIVDIPVLPGGAKKR